MTFYRYVETLARELGVEIDTDTDENACAFSLASGSGESLSVYLQGFDDRGTLLTGADLGEPPPHGRERLYETLLAANDLYGDTAGATLSLNRQTGRVRLQRYDDMNVLSNIGPAKALMAFADTAVAWKRVISGFRDAAAAEGGGAPEIPPSGAMMV